MLVSQYFAMIISGVDIHVTRLMGLLLGWYDKVWIFFTELSDRDFHYYDQFTTFQIFNQIWYILTERSLMPHLLKNHDESVASKFQLLFRHSFLLRSFYVGYLVVLLSIWRWIEALMRDINKNVIKWCRYRLF